MRRLTSASLLLSVLVSACGGDDVTMPQSADDSTTLDPNSDGVVDSATDEVATLELPMRWTLGPASYGEGAITWERSSVGRVVLFATTPPNDNRNGDYAGSSITLLFSGSGQVSATGSVHYFVVDNISNAFANGVSGVVNIVVTAGLQHVPLASTRWTSTTGIITVTYDNNQGQFYVSTPEPLILSRDFDQGAGIPNAPNHISFEMHNLHGINLCGDEGDRLSGRWC